MSYKYNYRFLSIEADPPEDKTSGLDKTHGLDRRTAFMSGQAVACRDRTPQVVYRRPIGGTGPWEAVHVIYPNGGRYTITDTDRTAMECIRVLESLHRDVLDRTREGKGLKLGIKALRSHFRLT